MKKALVVGIDKYPKAPLAGCENDAVAAAIVLQTNGDGSPNFETKLITSDNSNVTGEILEDEVAKLFSGSAETALLYFAGHGLINPNTSDGYLVAQDGKKAAWGLSMTSILAKANEAYPKIKSSVIVLDCCHSGKLGEVPAVSGETMSHIGAGLTILTACERHESSMEYNGHGLFTGLFLEAMNGAAADVCGRITPASIYAMVDQTLGAWDQRPIYKANVQNFITLRQTVPKVPLETLRNLHVLFPSPTAVFKLDPSFEPDRGEETQKLKSIAVKDENVQIYRQLQKCFQNGLVLPVDQPFMWHAAVYSTGCRLTALGAHYRKLAETKKI